MKKNPVLSQLLTRLSVLDYSFSVKPLVVGGMAMEYYQLRKSGDDIDLVVHEKDFMGLKQRYPDNLKDIFGDLGVHVMEFEIWVCILKFKYSFLSQGAVPFKSFLMISLEKLLFMKTLALQEKKYFKDVQLIVKKINDIQYGKDSVYPATYFKK